MRGLFATICLLAATPLAAQLPGTLQGGGPGPDLPTATLRVERSLMMGTDANSKIVDDLVALTPVSTAPPAAKERAAKVLREGIEAQVAGRMGDAQIRFGEVASLLLGRPWSADAIAANAIAVQVDELVADPSQPLHYRLSRLYPAPATRLTVKMALSTLAVPQRGTAAALPERQVAAFTTAPLAAPRSGNVMLGSFPDGSYALEAQVFRGPTLISKTRAEVTVVNGLLATGREFRARLAKLKVRDGAAATVTYPFDTAEAVNGWRRDIPDNLDFAASIARSRALLAELEAGRDPQWQATGDQYRAYYFTRGQETMPYRVYVPKAWRPGAKLPLVLILHGGGGNEDGDLSRPGRFAGLHQRLAEQHNVVIVAPLGYRPSGGYGLVYGRTRADRMGVRPTVTAGETGPTLSEAETLEAMARVAAEYGTDPARQYLVGNSMGGGGVWYLGGKHAAMWAAISPNGSSMPVDGYDFTQLRGMPVRIVVGGLDVELRRGFAQRSFDALKAQGEAVTLTVVPNENHGDAWLAVLPETYDFLTAHTKAMR